MSNDINDDELAEATPEEQRETMEAWIRERYEDPAERTPYESREGGYIWIWGGPYDAEEELRSRFEGVVPDGFIEDLAEDLSGDCSVWAPTPRPGDYDEGLFEAVSHNTAARQTLEEALNQITALLSVFVPIALEASFHRLLFANVITAFETYLSDTFINLVFADDALLQKYLDADPTFKDRKLLFKDVLREAAVVEDTARKELLDIVWHNIGKAKTLYRDVLGADLGDVNDVAVAIQTRHDIVHRNGRRKDGTVLSVTDAGIEHLIETVRIVAARLDTMLSGGEEEHNPDF